jgi:NADPH:quinone reductase-like Zn-dependent oxidoreductase
VVIKTSQGALAQYTRLSADQLTHKPTNVDFTQAAGISLAGMTAFQSLKFAQLEAGQTIFINGGSSSVGSSAIQIAKAKGCKVVTSCSTANVELVKGLGADEVASLTTAVTPSDQVNAAGD